MGLMRPMMSSKLVGFVGLGVGVSEVSVVGYRLDP
jgi:hypothetical protein